jgi:hypothetical protein
MAGFVRSALRYSYADPLVNPADGTATVPAQNFINTIIRLLQTQQAILLSDFGTAGNGGDDTAAFQSAVNTAVKLGGATIVLPPGNFSINTVTFPAGQKPITLIGMGPATVVMRRGNLAAGKGMFDILGSNVTLQNFVLDGNVTIPTGLFYNQDFTVNGLNDPMAPSLTANTSVWLHGPASNFSCQYMIFRHSGGYAPVVDCITGGIFDVEFLYCRWEDNRPFLFGFGASQAIYGAWPGGLYVNGDGRATNPGLVLHRLRVEGCTWLRNTGNAAWSHLYGLDELHESFRFINNHYEDQGLDGILIGGVEGGAVIGNVFRRIGYTTVNDTDQSVPRWLANLNATAIDSSGLVKSVLYEGNSMLSVNGGSLDLDGHGLSAINGNVSRIPYPDEPEYVTDQIAISGLGEKGSTSYGVNIGNSSKTPYGASDLTMVGNTLINLPLGSVRMFSARRCLLEANSIFAPSNSQYPPVALGPQSDDPNQRCFDNKVKGNHIDYSPAVAAPAIIEDDTYSKFLATESNTVCDNNPITGNGLATEFQKSPTSGSVHYAQTVWFP